ncbi:hypothetical protein GQR58_001748 [Nymphon striatum]|nr:hypothetical protein GQR58_001748 [Nymphon striatum]
MKLKTISLDLPREAETTLPNLRESKNNNTAKPEDMLKQSKKYVEEQIENKEKSPWEINERWKDLKNIIIKGAKKHIGYNNRKRIRKPWVTANMLNKMDERKKWKNVNNTKGKEMYKKLNNELRRETESAREKWWEEQCTELENIDKKGRSDLMYNKVKELTREKSKDKENTSIMGKDGIIIDDPTKVCERWKEYIEELYDKKGKPTEIYLEEAKTVDEFTIGPTIIRSEVIKAIKDMKPSKSEGVDGIPAEMIQKLGERGIEEIVELCQLIYEKGEWPEEFLETIMITIKKKVNATECKDHIVWTYILKRCLFKEVSKSENAVKKVMEAFQSLINPFEVDDESKLNPLACGAAASDEVTQEVLNAEEIGKKAKERLEKNERFFEPIKRQKLK